MQHNLSGNDIFLQLVGYINLEKPLSDASSILSDKLVIFMDQKKFTGIASWKKWIYEIHRVLAKKNKKLTVCFEDISLKADIYTITGKWIISGKRCSSKGIVKYQLKDDKICRIWTTKKNYIPIFGVKIVYPIYFYFVCCRIFFTNIFRLL